MFNKTKEILFTEFCNELIKYCLIKEQLSKRQISIHDIIDFMKYESNIDLKY